MNQALTTRGACGCTQKILLTYISHHVHGVKWHRHSSYGSITSSTTWIRVQSIRFFGKKVCHVCKWYFVNNYVIRGVMEVRHKRHFEC